MNKCELTCGKGRITVKLFAHFMGSDVVVSIFNKNAHIGAIALGEYDHQEQRASTSVFTRIGHRDNIIAQKAAYLISKNTKRPTCVIAGVHIDNISNEEMEHILENSSTLVDNFISSIQV